MSSVNSSLLTQTLTNWTMDITNMPCSYENVTSLDIMECNESNIDLVHDVTDTPSVHGSVLLLTILASISLWTVLANGLVFLCLVSSRNVLKNNVNIQLLSLSLTDMLVGISMISPLLASIPNLISRSETCSVILYLYFVAQAATLYHTFLICVHRLWVIRRKSNANHSNQVSLKAFLLQIWAIWVGCLLYCSIHLLAFVPFGTTVSKCNLAAHLFADDNHTALWLLTIPLFAPPYICTNTIYVYLLIFTKRKLRTVDILHVKPIESSDKIRLEQMKDNNTAVVEINSECHSNVRIQSAPQDSEEPGSSKGNTHTKCSATNDQKPSTSAKYKSKNNENIDQDRIVEENTMYKQVEQKPKPAITNKQKKKKKNTHLAQKLQRRALVTFGILLASLNLFMTPLVSVEILELLWHDILSRDAHIIFVLMAVLNSALNPIINIWRIKPFRMVLMEKARRLRFW